MALYFNGLNHLFFSIRTSPLLFIVFTLLLSACSTKPNKESNALALNTARYGHVAVNDGNKIYVLAGANHKGLLGDIDVIDPQTQQVTTLETRLIPRRYFSAVWDGKHSIYLIGGVSKVKGRYRFEKRVEVFNTITQEITFAQALPAPTRINSAVLFNERIFVFGGSYPSKKGLKASAIVSVLDIEQNKWMKAKNMPTAKTTRAVVKDGYIYVAGGYNQQSKLSTFERFDPKLNQWQVLPSMPEGVSAHSATVVGDKLFLFGDYDNLTSTYAYDFSIKKWNKIDIGFKGSRHNAATTLAEKTYVIGGNIGSKGPFLDNIQIFELSSL